MKRQYLGDSRDHFKWDYHDQLVRALGADELQVIWMMTPDDKTRDGQSPAGQYRGSRAVEDFCHALKRSRDPAKIFQLPHVTQARYRVTAFGADEYFVNRDRRDYFARITPAKGVIFLDPDNGFEPEKSCSRKHVRYADVANLLDRAPSSAVISVFQYFRRRPFPDDFARICQRLVSGHATAIYCHPLMFVSIAKSRSMRDRVREANLEYKKSHPVEVLP
jgi:hypothetical protein